MKWMDKYQDGGVVRDNTSVKQSKPYKKISKEQADILARQRYEEVHGTITPYEPQSIYSRIKEVVTNPMTAFGYAVRNQPLPEHFSRGERNPHDMAIDLVNPAYYATEASNMVENLSEGNFKEAGINALSISPLGLEAKGLTKLTQEGIKKGKRAYDTTRGGVRNLIELNAHNPSSVYHNVLRGNLSSDKTNTSLFRAAYEHKYGPIEATKKISEKVDKIIGDLKPGRQFRESSLSADSYRLLAHKAGALKNDFKIIPTGAYQPLNNKSNLRKELFDKYNNLDDIMQLEGDEFTKAMKLLEESSSPKINNDIVEKLTQYTNRLSRETGKNIPPPKIIAGRVHIPQLILERKGGNTLTELKRYGNTTKKGALALGAVELTDLALDAMFEDYESEISKLSRKQKEKQKEKKENGGWLSKYQEGGIIEDDRGQWTHPGKITKINSNDITMEGVNYPVLGISDEGDIKTMLPNKNYKFKGNNVTEFPIMKNGGGLQELDDLTNFTNYNTPQPKSWLNKYTS